LHGIVYRSTMKYIGQRTPSPSEIRLQYNLGLAYGAKGFLGFIYGYEPGDIRRSETYPGLVSHDPSQVDHRENKDVVYGRDSIWTGYSEKWNEIRRLNARLVPLGDSLISMKWIGAKGWSIDDKGNPKQYQSIGWEGIVTSVVATVPYGDPTRKYNDNCPLPPTFAEVGCLRKNSTDYIVVVNRRCANTDTARITVSLERGYAWTVTDIEQPSFRMSVPRGHSFTVLIEPGGGKVFRLAKRI
jgi:hypothetical protein